MSASAKPMFKDESWILLRQSGAAPVLRIYCEATSLVKTAQMMGEGSGWRWVELPPHWLSEIVSALVPGWVRGRFYHL